MSMTKSHRRGDERVGIGITFAQARIKAGLSQTEVARRLGIDQSTVSYWESGKKIPRASKLAKLADLYCCTIDESFGRSQDSA